MKYEYVECVCQSLEHTMRVGYDSSDDVLPLWFEFNLVQYRPWYSRICVAVKYIFGYRSKYGSFDTVCLSFEETLKIIDLMKKAYPGV